MANPISFTIRPPSQQPSPPSSSSSRQPTLEPTSTSSREGTPSGNASFKIPSIVNRPSPLGGGGRSSTISNPKPKPKHTPRDVRSSRRYADTESGDEEDEDGDGIFGHGPRQGGHPRSSRRTEEITGLREGGVEGTKSRPSGPMIIPAIPNRDWRESSMSKKAQMTTKRTPSYVPEQGGGMHRSVRPEDLVEDSNDTEVKAGLQYVKTEEVKEEGEGEGFGNEMIMNASNSASDVKQEDDGQDLKEEEPTETLDEKARKALIASATNPDGEASARYANMVISSSSDSNWMVSNRPADEGDAFREDVLTRPEESTMDDYANTPVEAFGEALLRGMGWNPGASTGQGVHVPKRRPAGLGLGATPKGVVEETGKGGKKDRGGKKKDEALGKGYLPVIKRQKNSTTTSTSTVGSKPTTMTDATSSGQVSRQSSRSPSPHRSRHGNRSERERERHRSENREDRYSEPTRDRRTADTQERDRRDRDRDGHRFETTRSRSRYEDDIQPRRVDERDKYSTDRRREPYDDRRQRDRERDGDMETNSKTGNGRDRNRESESERDRNRDRGGYRERDRGDSRRSERR